MLITELKDFKTKLEYHHMLNPDLWDDDTLRPEVHEKLKEIANSFIEDLEVPKSSIKDIIFTGSNTNYNWTQLSDIDLHIIVNPKGLDMNGLDAIKSLWNEEHNVSIRGFAVEVYVEDENTNQSGNAGLYSIKHNKWLREPKFENIKFDYEKIKAKAAKWMKKIDKLIDAKSTDVKALESIKEKIKKIRHDDLAKGGEFTLENLVFKALRNNGYIEKLFTYTRKLKDDNLSLK
jgi:predicted nucleotidyltransferase